MKRILVTGAVGQIGTELVVALCERYGQDRVVAADIRGCGKNMPGQFVLLDCLDAPKVQQVVQANDIGTIYHLAAILSATAEAKPLWAYHVNMQTLLSVLDASHRFGCSLFVPSSIGAFGPGTPRNPTPQDTVQRPTTMYGITKVAAELLCDYYHTRFGVDTRGLRFPGLISYSAMPGGGTTDYAVDIFHRALRGGRYTCFLSEDTTLDMMYMPDAVRAAIELMEAPAHLLKHRNAFNVTAMQFCPRELAVEIQRHLPEFEMDYDVDPIRQAIADSWPQRLDDSAARAEWGWAPRYGLSEMVSDMLQQLQARL